MLEYRIRDFRINRKHVLFGYCDTVTSLCCNLENAVRFRQRQLITAVKKAPADRTENERSVITEIMDTLPLMSKPYPVPSEKRYTYGYGFYDSLLKLTENPDYLAEGLPRQTAQQSIKKCVRDVKGFFSSVKAYKKDKTGFTGVPQFPGYHRKGGHATAVITNQDAVLRSSGKDTFLKLPLTKETLLTGDLPEGAKVKEVRIKPDNGTYVLSLVLECDLPDVTFSEKPERIAAIDMGVDNLMAVTNNCGLECLLYKGGAAKSVNRLYNKTAAGIVSEQTLSTGKKFVPTEGYYAITNHRNDTIRDLFHKTAKHFISWCVENRIDTIVMGKNRHWKQACDIKSDAARQNFVQLPFDMLRNDISYLAKANGIRYVEQEESYTSQASFVDRDYIPVYGKNDEKATFSGIRGPKRYNGMYKPSGFRGIYRTASGMFINSDLNGSANILRKAFPDAFKNGLDFTNVRIIRHPDIEKAAALKERQLKSHVQGQISHSKRKRDRSKGRTAA